MATIDEQIESAVVTLIAAAIPGATVKGRKEPGMREGDTFPIILVRCEYDSEDVGDNSFLRNVFYILDVFMQTRSSLADTGDETIKDWRQKVSKALFGPTITAVPEVDNITVTGIPSAVDSPTAEGVNTEGISFDVETYEGLT